MVVGLGAFQLCKKTVVGWRSLCVAQTSRSGRDRARERDAPTANLQLGDAPVGFRDRSTQPT
jgi:hypothetical protein